MNELRSIAEAHASFWATGSRSVLITLVHVEGSAYRRPGARMLVDEEGRIAGSVSGGCLEGDLAEHARMVLASGESKTVSYDLSASDDLAWGLGMGCPGRLQVLLEPFDEKAAGMLARWSAMSEPLVLCTVFDTDEKSPFQPGMRWAIGPNGTVEGMASDDPVVVSTLEKTLEAHRTRRSTATTLPEYPETNFFIEYLPPPHRLYVFGAGPDVVMLVRTAVDLGWDVTVIDPGAQAIETGRFPTEATVISEDPLVGIEDLPIDGRTAVVLMSHNYPRDRALLERLIPTPAIYIGMLGAASRRDALLSEIDGELRGLAEGRLHAPVGLDIGADRPEEIALSVAAEIAAVFAGRRGGFLRERPQPIHDRAIAEPDS
jgi:xanthine/CO dehydrogenase XdhC/CoxF family maturation factor